ncbi:MAG: hypothetical protein CL940_04325 [Deltaproteobacteria bacterium]|nr:hypothetical protein [Deltaproteobacteria bacterium]
MRDLPRDFPWPQSLCATCNAPPRLIRGARSTFLLCPVSPNRYPHQPVFDCAYFVSGSEDDQSSGAT